jgi:hypothetical protein
VTLQDSFSRCSRNERRSENKATDLLTVCLKEKKAVDTTKVNGPFMKQNFTKLRFLLLMNFILESKQTIAFEILPLRLRKLSSKS